MRKITNETLGSYADGELSPAEQAAVEEALAADAGLRAELEAQQRLRATLSLHYAPVAEEPVPDRFRKLLETSERPNVVDLAAARERRNRIFAWPNYAAIAASLAVGMIAGQLAFRDNGAPIAVEDGRMLASGSLARTLETQLASAQTAATDARVGLSFEDRDGRICRTFEAESLAGIACREQPGWTVTMTAAASGGGTEYRQAGVSSELVMEQAQAMMAGAAFDADAERRAREQGWKRR